VVEAFLTDHLTRSIGWALVQFVWQGTIVGILTGWALLLLRRNTAQVRYAVACIGLALMIAIPVATVVKSESEAPSEVLVDSMPAALPMQISNDSRQAESSTIATPSPWSEQSIEFWLPTAVQIWFIGVAALSLRMLGSWIVVQRLRRRATVPVQNVTTSLNALASRLRIARPVRVLESQLVRVPTAIGWLRPLVLLPTSVLTGLTTEQLEAVLAHELAHIRRHDYVVNIFQTIVETLLFYHPAVWFVSHRIRVEREHCCDDIAVAVCGNRLVYATALADLETLRSERVALAMMATGGGSLLHRVRRLLEPTSQHERRGTAWIAVWTLIALLAVTTTQQSAGSGIVEELPQPEAVTQRTPPSPPPPAPPAAPAPPAPPVPAFRGEGRTSWSDLGARYDIRYKGTIAISDDDREVTHISPDGYLTISDSGWFGTGHAVELRGRSDGSIERKFRESGVDKPYEPAGRAWFADVFPMILRRSGIAAEARVSRILRQSGPNGVLAEIGRLESDYVRRVYFETFFSQGRPTGSVLALALDQAGREISSDYELAELLIHASAAALADNVARSTFFNAATSVSSDYELRRVLTNATSAALDPRSLTDALTAAQSIRSDYEAAELLISISNKQTLDGAARRAFFDAVQSVSSDYECRRVLSAVVERSLSSDMLTEVLKSSTELSSDYEQATLLVLIADRHRLEGGLRDAYLSAAYGISSEHEKNRVMAALLRKGQ